MDEFNKIKKSIYNLFINKGFDYNKEISISKNGYIYKISLPLNNPTMPINLFISAENDDDCIDKVLHELDKRDLWRTSYNILKRVRVGNVGF